MRRYGIELNLAPITAADRDESSQQLLISHEKVAHVFGSNLHCLQDEDKEYLLGVVYDSKQLSRLDILHAIGVNPDDVQKSAKKNAALPSSSSSSSSSTSSSSSDEVANEVVSAVDTGIRALFNACGELKKDFCGAVAGNILENSQVVDQLVEHALDIGVALDQTVTVKLGRRRTFVEMASYMFSIPGTETFPSEPADMHASPPVDGIRIALHVESMCLKCRIGAQMVLEMGLQALLSYRFLFGLQHNGFAILERLYMRM